MKRRFNRRDLFRLPKRLIRRRHQAVRRSVTSFEVTLNSEDQQVHKNREHRTHTRHLIAMI